MKKANRGQNNRINNLEYVEKCLFRCIISHTHIMSECGVCACVSHYTLCAFCYSHSTLTVCYGAFFVSINITIPHYCQCLYSAPFNVFILIVY